MELANELEAVRAKINAEQGDLGLYQEKLAKCSTQKADLEAQLVECQDKLAAEERNKAMAGDEKRSFDREIGNVKQDLADIQSRVERSNAEKSKLDGILRGLNDDVMHKDETIAKLNKEKKYASEHMGKASEDLATNQDKLDHLNEVKTKLETTLDQMESAVEAEKRSKANTEKERRKLEGDLKMSQEAVADMERRKREIEQAIMRKDTEIHQMMNKLDDEQSGMNRYQKGVKELTARVEEMEEELEAERQGRTKADRQRQDLSRELDELTERLDESCHATAAQVELNKKRESEIHKMRKDVEENNIHHESTLLSLRKKHQDSIAEMSEQTDQLGKLKARIEKDKMTVRMQLDDTRAAIEHVLHDKAVAEKNIKGQEATLATLQKKVDENVSILSDYESSNKRMTSENANLFTRLEELLGNASMLQKVKAQLQSQLDDVKRMADDEAKERQSLLGRFRTLEHEFDGVKSHLDDEVQQKDEVGRSLNKVIGEVNHWRAKYEQDALAKIEELEASKVKLQARLAESEATMENQVHLLIIVHPT